MTEFKVGDKVTHPYHGTVEVTYGPYKDSMGEIRYMMRFSGEAEQPVSPSMLTPLPAFAVGDKVRHEGILSELVGGPVTGRTSGEDLFLLKFLEGPDAGKGVGRRASNLEPIKVPAIVPVGTRVRVNRAKFGEETHGMIGTVTSNTEDFGGDDGDAHPYRVELGGSYGRVFAAEVTPVDDKPADGFEYEGVTYEYGVRYTDNDGDPWTFERSTVHGQPVSDDSSCFIGDSIASAVRDYGPLTKHTA
ncbi:phiSA1p31-related protein [Streptomyces sp. NBC_01212]|uniref:phiSA1p31-related protein n=1 Tax=Streptomyces sp. NBC_01212 TaxID=2903775 RepID=UPI002E130092|nr:phiSA1p31-related protein [Streptomyces sp. NBC_01212]